MPLDPPTTTELAEFTGVGEDDLGDYADRALADAVLLFRLATGLSDWPAEEVAAALARNGVLSMAEALYLSQPYRATLAKPFASESIGSYSYSKLSSAVAGKLPTGIGWFDLAVGQLSAEGALGAAAVAESVSISVVEADGVVTVTGADGATSKAVLSPASPLYGYLFGLDSAVEGQSSWRGNPRG